MTHAYIVRVGSDTTLSFPDQHSARSAINDAVIAAERGSVVTTLEKLCDLAAFGTAQLTDGRTVTIMVESDCATAGR